MLKDLKYDLKSFWDEYPLAATCMAYGACGGNRSVIDTVYEATIYMQGYNREKGRISDIHLAVNSKYLKNDLRKMCISLLVYILLRDISWILVLVQLAQIIIWSLRDIADEDYCVYTCIKELDKKERNKLFLIEHIMATNKGCKCDRQKSGFQCRHLGRAEDCTCDRDKVRRSLNILEKQGIVEKVDKFWKRAR